MIATAVILKTAGGYMLALHAGPFEVAEDASDYGEEILALMAGIERAETDEYTLPH